MGYTKIQNRQIQALGFIPQSLSKDMREILLQPLEAPENYHQDGEVSNMEARDIWASQMRKAGFTALQIFHARTKMKL